MKERQQEPKQVQQSDLQGNKGLSYSAVTNYPSKVIQRASEEVSSWETSAPYEFTLKSALQAITADPRGTSGEISGRESKSGVQVGDIGSYKIIQYLEKVGDNLTGDHQPSGAAIKEAIRMLLHEALDRPLTRSAARIAYGKAITIVMTDEWHKDQSRTYGGRNTQAQIKKDAKDLVGAAIKDWIPTVDGLRSLGFTEDKIKEIWKEFDAIRVLFFQTGSMQFNGI